MLPLPPLSPIRLRLANAAPVRAGGRYVLYWMVAQRRLGWNAALQHSVARAEALGLPLVILEPLRVGYPWASDRIHRFVLDGMADHAAALAGGPVAYYPYVEPNPGAGKGLLAALAAHAALVVTDAYPTFFLPKMLAAAAARLDVALEVVDGCGLLPLDAADRDFATAHAFRRHLQKVLRPFLSDLPVADPLAGRALRPAQIPAEIAARWPLASPALLLGEAGALAALPIDHGVSVAPLRGGATEGKAVLSRFLRSRLERYAEDRNDPVEEVASGLSPYLHFGHVGAAQVFSAVVAREGWTPERLGTSVAGHRAGWWGMGAAAESFLDELVTWRELGYGFCHHRPDAESYASLPPWARQTLNAHAADPRPHRYDASALARGQTHDRLWNAAQGQLTREGRIHNYLRMLWGKKILEWSPSPEAALETMIDLNNRYALDGRDPNSLSGIFWVLGRFDRAWGPERPIYGTVRYMSSDNTARKLDVKAYIQAWHP